MGRKGKSSMSGGAPAASSNSTGGGLSNVQLGTLRYDPEEGYVPTGEHINVDLSDRAAVMQAAGDYFNYLNKSDARSRAEDMMKGANESNDFGGYLIRNTIQTMYSSQAGNRSTRVYNSEIDKALSETQKNAIYSIIQSAAKNFIERDKQSSKAGANYWRKRGF